MGHKLDGQFHHGYPGPFGLRTVAGNDPAGPSDFFSMGQAGPFNNLPSWRQVLSGATWFKDNFAAGTAFLEILRADAKGIQLSRPAQHEMVAILAGGLQGWVWTAPGTRSQQTLTNPVWMVVNMLLRARGLRCCWPVSWSHSWSGSGPTGRMFNYSESGTECDQMASGMRECREHEPIR